MTERKVMLIAGANGSVGGALVAEALAQGWAVAAHGRSPERLPARGDWLEPIAEDITSEGAEGRIVQRTLARFGRLDAAVDCVATGPAGARITGLFPDTDPAGYAAFYDLSAAWFQRLAHAAYAPLAERGGTLIAFVSDAGRYAAARQSIIGAARAATIGFVRNLAIEAARDGIRAHAISPSFIAGSASAERMGSDRMAKAEARAGLGLPTAQDLTPLVLFLCGKGAAKITGQVISVNGGLQA